MAMVDEPEPKSAFRTVMVRSPNCASPVTVTDTRSREPDTRVVLPTDTPDPATVTVAPAAKAEPPMSTTVVVARAKVEGLTDVTLGGGFTVKQAEHVATSPDGLVTVTGRGPGRCTRSRAIGRTRKCPRSSSA